MMNTRKLSIPLALLLALLLVLPPATAASPPVNAARQQHALDAYMKMPLYFVANRGQRDESVAYYAQGGGYSLAFTASEATMTLGETILRARFAGATVRSSIAQVCTTTLSGIYIAGPTTATIGAPCTFAATAVPPTATLPITYTWQATEQSDVVTTTYTLSHTVSYTWAATGTKVITVTAANCGSVVSRTHTITLEPLRLYLPLVMRNWPPSTWHSQCADCPRFFDTITQRSLVLDSGARPHVAYGGDSLYHAWHNGTSWQFEVADEGPNVGKWASIALDSNDYPHISYYDSDNGDLKYAHWDGATWISETVDIDGGWDSFIVVDGADRPHIAYRDAKGASGTALKYAHWGGAVWQIDTIEALISTISSRNTTLALESTAPYTPHISYSVSDSGNPDYLYHAYLDGSDWQTETVETAEYIGDNALALDSAGHSHIAYYTNDGSTDRLKHAWWDGSLWQSETVATGNSIAAISLAVDGSDDAHVSYYLSADDSIRYAYQNGSWQFEPVESGLGGLEMGEISSLILDSAGGPHLLYLLDSDALRYAHREGAAWQPETVDQGGDPGRYSFIVLDQTERPHIIYADQSRMQLKYAAWDGAAWQTQVVAQGIWNYAFYYSGLALDSSGAPHVAYNKNDPLWGNTLYYAYWNGAAWQTQEVASKDVGSASKAAALVLDAAGRPHIAHGVWNGIAHTYWDGAAWQSETVDAQATSSSSRLSLALDDTSRLHLAYWDMTNEVLKYAYKDGAGWHTQTVDDEGRSPWIALDSANRPHISYCRIPGSYCDELRYARWDGTQWIISTLEGGGDTGFYTSLALDSADRPRISYYSLADGSVLKYASWDGAAWQIETVDNNEGSGYYTAMALDSAGRPHISHYDFHAKELRYTWWGP